MLARTYVRWAGVAALLVVAACAESPTGIQAPESTFRGVPSFSLSPVTSGTFHTFLPNNLGPEFWDTQSVDGLKCNIGFFAVGDLGPCSSEKAGTVAEQGGFAAGMFLGTGANGDASASFTFPAGAYHIRFKGGFRGAGTPAIPFLPENTIGYYTGSGQGKMFTPFVGVDAGTEVNISVNQAWGLYLEPGTNVAPSSGECGSTATTAQWCSGEGRNMWAMFRSADKSKYLFGVEDRPDGVSDADYNDHFIALETIANPSVGTGRMTGGVTIPSVTYRNLKVSLTIHCDNKLSNNIQINWGNGQKWHLDKNSLSDVACQKIADPRPPVADIDVFTGNATGTLNNKAGSKLSFSFYDGGEPGRQDKVSLTITNSANTVVLTVVDAIVRTGNLQAHIDQPHTKK